MPLGAGPCCPDVGRCLRRVSLPPFALGVKHYHQYTGYQGYGAEIQAGDTGEIQAGQPKNTR